MKALKLRANEPATVINGVDIKGELDTPITNALELVDFAEANNGCNFAYVQYPGMPNPVNVYIDCDWQGGGWMLLGYGHANGMNFPWLGGKNGNYSYSPTSRANAAGRINEASNAECTTAADLAKGSSEVAMMVNRNNGAVSSGGISNYSRQYTWTLTQPGDINFGIFMGGNTACYPGNNVTVSVKEYYNSSLYDTHSRQTNRQTLSCTWSDSYPTGYGAWNASPSGGNNQNGIFMTNILSGQRNQDCNPVCTTTGYTNNTYNHQSSYTITEGNGATGGTAMWVR
jgi:hypothetical protein